MCVSTWHVHAQSSDLPPHMGPGRPLPATTGGRQKLGYGSPVTSREGHAMMQNPVGTVLPAAQGGSCWLPLEPCNFLHPPPSNGKKAKKTYHHGVPWAWVKPASCHGHMGSSTTDHWRLPKTLIIAQERLPVTEIYGFCHHARKTRHRGKGNKFVGLWLTMARPHQTPSSGPYGLPHLVWHGGMMGTDMPIGAMGANRQDADGCMVVITRVRLRR